MSVNFYQRCIVGFVLDQDICSLEQEAIYKSEDRYDTITGEVTHQEEILVREEQTLYKFQGLEDTHLGDLGYQIENKYHVKCVDDGEGDQLVIGYNVASNEDYGRADLLVDVVPLGHITKAALELRGLFPNQEIMLHFIAYAS